MLWPRAHAIPRVNKVKNWASWCINNLNYNKGVGQSAYHLPMTLPFLAQRLFLIQISWNLKSVLSFGSYTWKNGQSQSTGRTVRQNQRFSGDSFFSPFGPLEKFFQQKFLPKKSFEIYRNGRYDDIIAINFLGKFFFSQIDSKWSKTWKKRSPENCRFCRTVRPADRIWPFLHV